MTDTTTKGSQTSHADPAAEDARPDVYVHPDAASMDREIGAAVPKDGAKEPDARAAAQAVSSEESRAEPYNTD